MEEWRDVTGFEEYFKVSTLGRVWSKRSNIILNQHKRRNGYMTISTKIGGRKGQDLCFKVHRLVAEAFLPNEKNLPVVNHLNGVKDDNRLDNLEWTDYSGNAKHAYNMGLIKPPSNKRRRRLSDEEVKYVLENYCPRDREYGARALGRKFGVNKSCILRLIKHNGYRD